MEPRLDLYKTSPDAIKAMLAFSAATEKLGLEKSLLELVKLRASQINGCAFCVDMHSADARKNGETERRLYALPAWRETPFFTPRERAALDWTEAVTQISTRGAPEELYAALGAEFTPKEQMDLTLAISMINCWNRLAISFHMAPAA